MTTATGKDALSGISQRVETITAHGAFAFMLIILLPTENFSWQHPVGFMLFSGNWVNIDGPVISAPTRIDAIAAAAQPARDRLIARIQSRPEPT